jgi:hypothetical protein
MIVTVSLARLFLVVLLLLLTPVVRSEAADERASVPQAAPPPPPAAIPLAEVASRATEVEALLRTVEALGVPSREIAAVQRELPEESARLELELQRTLGIVRGQPTLEWLEGAEELWGQWQRPLTTSLRGLTERATQLQEGLTSLADARQTWTQTQDAARAANAPESILQKITGVLAAIESAQKALLATRATVLDLQSRVAQGVSRCQAALAHIKGAQKHALEGLLVRDHPPLWSGEAWSAWPDVFRHVRDKAADWWVGIILFVRAIPPRVSRRLWFCSWFWPCCCGRCDAANVGRRPPMRPHRSRPRCSIVPSPPRCSSRWPAISSCMGPFAPWCGIWSGFCSWSR